MFLQHPITGRYVLYANPGYATRVEGLTPDESNEPLEMLFQHQLQPKYGYVHHWTGGDVLMWDDIGTLQQAIADYSPSDRRHMKRVRIKADASVG